MITKSDGKDWGEGMEENDRRGSEQVTNTVGGQKGHSNSLNNVRDAGKWDDAGGGGKAGSAPREPVRGTNAEAEQKKKRSNTASFEQSRLDDGFLECGIKAIAPSKGGSESQKGISLRKLE